MPSLRPIRPALAALAASASVVACASAPEVRSEADLVEAIAQASDQLDGALALGRGRQRAVMFSEEHEVVGRYNPASCPCPAFEVYVDGRWQRVSLRWTADSLDPNDALERARQMAQRGVDAERYPLYVLTVLWVRERSVERTAIDYPLVLVSDIVEVGSVGLARAIDLSTLEPDVLRRMILRGPRPRSETAPTPAPPSSAPAAEPANTAPQSP